jgi:hypothetical protein
VTALLREYRAAQSRVARMEIAATMKRRHHLYPFPHALSADNDRYGPCPPNLQVPSPEGFFNTVRPDVFHFKLNVAKYTIATLDEAIMCSPRALHMFEARVATLGRFRTRRSGRLYPHFTTKLVGLKKQTCHQRLASLMYYIYGLGSGCSILVTGFRQPALDVVNLSVTLLLAMSNLRPVTRREAHQLFTVVGRELFKALSRLRAVVVRLKRRRAEPEWRMQPDKLLARDSSSAASDTASTMSEEDNPPVRKNARTRKLHARRNTRKLHSRCTTEPAVVCMRFWMHMYVMC